MVTAKDMAREVEEIKTKRENAVVKRTVDNLEYTKEFCNETLSEQIKMMAESGKSHLSMIFGRVYPFDNENVCRMYFKQKYWGKWNEQDINLPKIKQMLTDHGYKIKVIPISLPYAYSEEIDGYRLEIEW